MILLFKLYFAFQLFLSELRWRVLLLTEHTSGIYNLKPFYFVSFVVVFAEVPSKLSKPYFYTSINQLT